MDATEAQIIKLCDEAKQHHFYTVCVNSGYVPLAVQQLAGSGKVCSVIGFPSGGGADQPKPLKHRQLSKPIAQVRYGYQCWLVKSGKIDAVKADIKAVRDI